MNLFVERCMRLSLTEQDRQRILLRGRVKADEVVARYKSWQEQMLASDELRAQAEQYWAMRRAQKAHKQEAGP